MKPMLLAWWLAIVSHHMPARRLSSKARDAVLVLAAVLALLLPACSHSTQDAAVRSAVEVSNNTAATIDSLQNSAETFYELEQNLSLAYSVNKGEGKSQAVVRVLAIRKAWLPVWEVLEQARVAHRALVVLIESGQQTVEGINAAKAKIEELTTKARARLAEARARVEN